MHLAPNPYPILFNDPKTVLRSLFPKCFQQAVNDRHHMVFVLSLQSQHNESRELLRRVGTDVGEVRIKRHKDAAFSLAQGRHLRIRFAAKILFKGGRGFVFRLSHPLCYIYRKVFIDLEFHECYPSAETGTIRSRASCAA